MRGFNSLSAVGVQMIYAGSWSWQLLGFRAAGLLQLPLCPHVQQDADQGRTFSL